MDTEPTKATCLLCKAKFSDSGMTKHLKTCLEKSFGEEKNRQSFPFFHLLIKGKYLDRYWLHLKFDIPSALGNLDRFLRNIWLECCGHLREFKYGNRELPMN